jgi:hypothetical protein
MLYKYCTAERIDVLKNLRVGFTRFTALNDPFECLFALEPREDEQVAAENDNYVAERAEVMVWLEARIGQLGVLCLSRTRRSLLMWSHYANNHTGFLVGLDENDTFFTARAFYVDPNYGVEEPLRLPGFGSLREVAYSGRRAIIGHGDAVPWDFFFQKSPEWRYEKEVRMFRTLSEATTRVNNGATGLFALPATSIQEVVIGSRMATDHSDSIVSALNQIDLRHVRLFRAELAHLTFALEFTRIRPH